MQTRSTDEDLQQQIHVKKYWLCGIWRGRITVILTGSHEHDNVVESYLWEWLFSMTEQNEKNTIVSLKNRMAERLSKTSYATAAIL